jgi:hypothetical protein
MNQGSRCYFLLCWLFLQQIQSFHITPASRSSSLSVQRNQVFSRRRWKPDGIQSDHGVSIITQLGRNSDTRLFMYNLPPGKDNNNGLGDILKGAGGLLLVAAFFASPLGGLVFGIFNSFLLLAILLPTVATLGFQAWQYFSTIGGTCPSCEAPARVIKTDSDGEAFPTICVNCGAVLQANYDNTAIDNITGKNSIMDDNFGSQPASIYDLFGGAPGGYTTSTSTTSTTTGIYEDESPRSQKKVRNVRNDMNIIDAEIEDDGDDEPFQ